MGDWVEDCYLHSETGSLRTDNRFSWWSGNRNGGWPFRSLILVSRQPAQNFITISTTHKRPSPAPSGRDA